MNVNPFSLTKRRTSPYYYVRFKDEFGKYLTWISTKESDYEKAVKKSWEIYLNKKEDIKKHSIKSFICTSDISNSEVETLLKELQNKGILKSYTMSNSESDVPALDYFISFWNEDSSQYLKDKKRKGNDVHKKHLSNNIGYINNYWKDILEDKSLGDISKKDIQKIFDKLDCIELNGNTKNHIIRSVFTPLKYAYSHDIINCDITSGWTFYKVVYKKRLLLDENTVRKLIFNEWECYEAKVANILSLCTGMRAGEILALTLDDVEDDCIYVNHSWNNKDKLKCTKNTESRVEYIYFSSIIEALRKIGSSNPYNEGRRYIFYSSIPDKPMEEKKLLEELRKEVLKTGFDENRIKEITFHSWRHFYTSYMKGKIDDKLLQSQTGHKSHEMLEHYGNHEIEGDRDIILNAQKNVFSAFGLIN